MRLRSSDRQAPVERTAASPRRRALGLPRTFVALRNRDFRMLWIGTLGSFTAMQMQLVARGYLAYAITGSAAALGIVTLARGLPQLVFTLFGGVLADRVRKRNLLLVTQTATGIISLATAILVYSGQITIWQLVVLGLLEGSVFSFNMPARQAFLPELVGQKDLMNAIALNNAGMNFTRIFGPALAGTLIGLPAIGLEKVFFFMSVCYLLPVFMLTRIQPKFGSAQRKARGPVLKELGSGLRYIRQHEVLGMLIVLGFVPIILGFSYQTLLPVFQKQVLHVGPKSLGLMSSAAGIGALVGALFIASYTNIKRRGMMQLITGAGFGVSLVLFALSRNFAYALGALSLVGFSGSVYQSLNTSLITSKTNAEFYGRVMSVNQLGFSLNMIAPLPIGIAVDRVGAPTVVGINGLLITLFVFGVATLVGSYRRLESEAPAEAAAERAVAQTAS